MPTGGISLAPGSTPTSGKPDFKMKAPVGDGPDKKIYGTAGPNRFEPRNRAVTFRIFSLLSFSDSIILVGSQEYSLAKKLLGGGSPRDDVRNVGSCSGKKEVPRGVN